MSRQSKMARKRASRVKGPAKTEPKHGKQNRWPYRADDPKRGRQG